MRIKFLGIAIALALISGCTLQLETVRHEIATGSPSGREINVNIFDANLGGGEQAYVNASIIAQLKAGAPGVTMVGAGENLSIDVELLPAQFMQRWYTLLSFGFVKLYYQLGSVRVVNQDTGKILAVHEIVLSGRRVRSLGLADYQNLVLPEVVKLISAEMGSQGMASAPVMIDVSEDLVAVQ